MYLEKKEILFHLPLLSLVFGPWPFPPSCWPNRPAGPFPPHGPLALLLLFLGWPISARQLPSCLLPSSVADIPALPVSSSPHLLPRVLQPPARAWRNRRRTAPAPRASWARRPLLGLVLKEPDPRAHPAALPALVFTLAKHRGTRNRRCRDLRAPSTAPPRGQPPPSRLRLRFALGELRCPPLYLPVALFLVLLASRALAASSAGHGRRSWRPPR